MTTLKGAGRSANVKKAKLVTKAGYDVNKAFGIIIDGKVPYQKCV